MRKRLTIGNRELSAISREKTIVLALLIQLFVAAFSSFLVVGLTSLSDPSSVEGGEVEIAAVGNATDELVAASRGTNTDVVRYPSETDARLAFDEGRVDTVVEARYDPTDRGKKIAIEALVPQSSLRKTLIVVQLRETLERLERQERRERAQYIDAPLVPLPPAVQASPYFGFTYTILLPLLLFLPVFISGSIAVDSVTEEIERGTLELLRVAPVSLTAIVDGKALAMAALAPLQAVLWIALLSVNGIGVSNVPSLVLVVASLAVGLVAVGVGLAIAVPSRQRAQLLYSLAILVFFTGATALPEHPAGTVAKLAVDSPTATTQLMVLAYAAAALALAAVVRAAVARVDPESL